MSDNGDKQTPNDSIVWGIDILFFGFVLYMFHEGFFG